ncbi:glycosyltransferase [Flavobacterium branchiicola]|uniref:Glycosyltransferase n=1 Tax=Flavobacterium branchiicola TaxID=1114875 RepID=A0ABV9PHU7_9FLAO|nr:glycosyltransferase [Flavobacterium branchiicola]MBS7255454.1 glycosyltransferase [Flavobacterium branchiicola]
MSNTPLVSVLTALYNHEKYVKEALDSVLKEDYTNKELIIINDGSSDNSEEIVKRWIKENEHLVSVEYYFRPNKGVCETANELVAKARGKYIVWLPSDDVLYGNTISERVRLLEQNEEKGKLVLVSDAKVINSEGEIILNSTMTEYNRGNKEKYKYDEGIIEEVLMNPSISGAVLMINKALYNIIGVYPKDINAEDWFFIQRAAAIKSILFQDKPVSLYRVHDYNTSGAAIPLLQRRRLIVSIIKTFYRNIKWFKERKYKLMCIKQFIRYNLIYVKINLRIYKIIK